MYWFRKRGTTGPWRPCADPHTVGYLDSNGWDIVEGQAPGSVPKRTAHPVGHYERDRLEDSAQRVGGQGVQAVVEHAFPNAVTPPRDEIYEVARALVAERNRIIRRKP